MSFHITFRNNSSSSSSKDVPKGVRIDLDMPVSLSVLLCAV